MKKTKILLTGPLPPPYMGPTFATEVILNSSLADEFELIHFDTSDHRPLETLGAFDFMNVWLGIQSYFVLLYLLVRHWPRVVYIPISQTTLGYLRDMPYILLSRLFCRRTVCHLRGGNFRNWYDNASFLTRWFVRRVHRRLDGQIVLGECLKPLFRGIIPEERIFVCANGKDVEIDAGERNGKPDDDEGPINLLFFANLIRTKGVLDTLNAFRIASRTNDRIHLYLAGTWNEPDVKEEIDEQLEQDGDLRVTCIGPVVGDKKKELFREADVFVFPTYYAPEGHPWVVIEAMANSLPIISTRHATIPESVNEGENGFLVDLRDTDQIADKMLKIASNLDLRKSMSMRSRELYLERFTEQKMVDSMSRIFHKLSN